MRLQYGWAATILRLHSCLWPTLLRTPKTTEYPFSRAKMIIRWREPMVNGLDKSTSRLSLKSISLLMSSMTICSPHGKMRCSLTAPTACSFHLTYRKAIRLEPSWTTFLVIVTSTTNVWTTPTLTSRPWFSNSSTTWCRMRRPTPPTRTSTSRSLAPLTWPAL